MVFIIIIVKKYRISDEKKMLEKNEQQTYITA